MFFESAFGICLGCKPYTLFNREPAQLCPGGACGVPAQGVLGLGWTQRLVLVASMGIVLVTAQWVRQTAPAARTFNAPPDAAAMAGLAAQPPVTHDPVEAERCKVPDFSVAIGHEAQWKLHNHCQ
jgi:hypothetical protein